MINNICADCIHVEVCGWCDSVTHDKRTRAIMNLS